MDFFHGIPKLFLEFLEENGLRAETFRGPVPCAKVDKKNNLEDFSIVFQLSGPEALPRSSLKKYSFLMSKTVKHCIRAR